MTIDKIEKQIKKLVDKGIDRENFIYDLLLAFGTAKATVKRLREGNSNLSKEDGKVTWKKWLTFKELKNEDLYLEVTKLKEESKHSERFIVVTDYKYLLAIDTKTNDKLDIEIEDIARYFDFFLPFAGMEKTQYQSENPADVKAAERMARLFDEIRNDNPNESEEFKHDLNIFFTRLLFCYFAEDTGIFNKGQFTGAISSLTDNNGSDLGEFLDRLFTILDTSNGQRGELPDYFNKFPYVNGGLFTEKIELPKFTAHSRRVMIDAGELDWAAINPDIFGSMFQGVISTEKRSNLGMHYTSVPNIMKVINPLFLDELKEEMEKAAGEKTPAKLYDLLKRIRAIKIFDPACGSGNFLIIAYKELRRLEMEIYNKIQNKQMLILEPTGIQLSNFYGIEIDDFACEVGKLALWIAEHQMHVEAERKFGYKQPTLPLQEAGKIVCGNATRLNWNQVCPVSQINETYVLGNPPYLGSSMQNSMQKKELEFIFDGFKNYKNLDYITCWFKKGSDYIKGKNISLAFVSTNSISQGEQVHLLWPYIFNQNLNISFAYAPFYWSNSAKSKAAVIVSIIGLTNDLKKEKYLFTNDLKKKVKNITPYLNTGSNITIPRRAKPLSDIPKMVYGNKSTDDGKLFLSLEEKEELLKNFPESEKYIKKLVGSIELIQGLKRYCLWIDDDDVDEAKKIDFIDKRLKEVVKFRLESKAESTVKYAEYPHRFKQRTYTGTNAIVIPRVSSERRKYVPFGYVDNETVVLDSAQAIYSAEPWILSVILSETHNSWVRITSGRLKSDIRYSSALSYNSFPFPKITKKQKEELEECAFKILDVRERYPEKTLAQLYDPDKMPEDLREAHRENDLAVERCYRSKPFETDEERLEYLFKLYEKMTAKEK